MKLPELAEKIARTFDLSDLIELCFQLSIDDENLSGQNKRSKIISLVNYCKNRRQLEELVNQCQKLRPQETWHFDESWYEAKPIPPQPKQPNLRVWITGAIIFVLLIFGLVNFLPSFLPSDAATPTEIAEATLTHTLTPTDTPTETVTLVPTIERTNEPTSTPEKATLETVPTETTVQILPSNTPVPIETPTQVPPTNIPTQVPPTNIPEIMVTSSPNFSCASPIPSDCENNNYFACGQVHYLSSEFSLAIQDFEAEICTEGGSINNSNLYTWYMRSFYLTTASNEDFENALFACEKAIQFAVEGNDMQLGNAHFQCGEVHRRFENEPPKIRWCQAAYHFGEAEKLGQLPEGNIGNLNDAISRCNSLQ